MPESFHKNLQII